jgi:hypothetical protein
MPLARQCEFRVVRPSRSLVPASRRDGLGGTTRIERASNANHAGGKVRFGEDAETSLPEAGATRSWRPLPCSIPTFPKLNDF